MSAPARLEMELIERDALRDLYELTLGDKPLMVAGATALVASGLTSDPLYNRVLATQALDDAVLGTLERHLDERCVRWMLAGPQDESFRAELTRRGYTATNPWMKFYRPAEEMPQHRSAFRIARLGADDGDSFVGLVESVFGLPGSFRAPLAALWNRPAWHCFGAFDGTELVAVGVTFVRGEYAWLGFGATASHARARGAQSALLAARVTAAARAGARIAVVETGVSSDGRPGASYRNIVRAGFREGYIRPNFLRAGSVG